MEQAIKGFMASMFPLSFFNLSPAFPFSPLESPHLVQDVCVLGCGFESFLTVACCTWHTHTCWVITWPPVASGRFTYWIIQFREQHWRCSHTDETQHWILMSLSYYALFQHIHTVGVTLLLLLMVLVKASITITNAPRIMDLNILNFQVLNLSA